MQLSQYTLYRQDTLSLTVTSGHYHIKTQTTNELIIDARKTYNKLLLPSVCISENEVRLTQEPHSRLFKTQRGVEATIITPELFSIYVKQFSGELQLSGNFTGLSLHLRTGLIRLNGPGFACRGGTIKLFHGNLVCNNMAAIGYTYSNGLLTHTSGLYISTQLYLGSVDFT